MRMWRTQLYIPDMDMKKLKDISKEEGISVSELIRQLIKKFLSERK